MTITAFVGCSRVLIVDVTFSTVDLCMGTIESIICLRIMIEIGEWRPLLCGVAVITFLAELAFVEVIVAVAAGRIDGSEMTLRVATGAGYRLMLTREFESAQLMIKEGNAPGLEPRMAAVTILIFGLLNLSGRKPLFFDLVNRSRREVLQWRIESRFKLTTVNICMAK